MKYFIPILFWYLPLIAMAQAKDTMKKVSTLIQTSQSTLKTTSPKEYKPEIFTSGFIDVLNNGQVNASARFIRLNVGEPGKFSIPLSLYSGVSSNNFQNTAVGSSQRSNEVLVLNFINPLSGLVNISVDGVGYFNKKNKKVTKAALLYHFGERILTGIRTGLISDPRTGKPINFLNSFGSLGLYFQTGAWDRGNEKNVGISWLAFRYIGCYSNKLQLQEIIPDIQTNGLYHGYSVAWGVEISNLVNIKAVYYKYVKKPEINYYLPIYQFSFNYSLKK